MLERIGRALKVNEIPDTIYDTAVAWKVTGDVLGDMKKSGIPTGAWSDDINANMAKKLPLRFLRKACIETPFDEEIEHRIHTSVPIINESRIVNLAMSTRFAMRHNRKFDGSLDTSKVPYGQFIGGLFFAKIAKDRNIIHSMIAHSTWNLICFGAIKLEQAKDIMKGKLRETRFNPNN